MTTQTNIINDIGAIIKVPNKALAALITKENLCIGSAIHDALIEGLDATVLNIGIGTLSIDLKDMQCKFIPSKELKTIIKKSISEKIDPLEVTLEQALVDKLQNICSEVF